jgi:hypothetical protein
MRPVVSLEVGDHLLVRVYGTPFNARCPVPVHQVPMLTQIAGTPRAISSHPAPPV